MVPTPWDEAAANDGERLEPDGDAADRLDPDEGTSDATVPEHDPTAGTATVANAAAGAGRAFSPTSGTGGHAVVTNVASTAGPESHLLRLPEVRDVLRKIFRRSGQKRGRRKGTTYWTEARLRAAIPGACQALVERNRRRPTQLEVAAELGIPASSFDRYLTEWRLRDWLHELLGSN